MSVSPPQGGPGREERGDAAPGALDLDRLMEDLRERVAARRAAGEYDPRVLGLPFLAESGGQDGTIRLRPEAAYSSKPLVGRTITLAKRTLIRALFHFLDDAVSQANAALERARASADAERRAREALEARLAALEAELAAPGERAEAPAAPGADPALERRVAALEEERAGARLARLERADRPPADPAELRPLAPGIAALAGAAREGAGLGPPLPVDPGGDARLDAYLAHADPAGPVLDLAPGQGALLARAAAAGIPARAVPPGDPLAALAAEAPGSLGGIVALGLGDRLEPEGWRALADLAATRLRPGGGLVLEIVNPLTLAGRALRLRDPGLAPPVHPETLAFLLRAAGLAEVEERALGAFTGPEALPLDPDPLDAGDERMNEVVHFVNGRVVGRPLLAILARLPAA